MDIGGKSKHDGLKADERSIGPRPVSKTKTPKAEEHVGRHTT